MGPKAAGVINKMISGIDKVLGGLQKSLEAMLKPKPAKALGALQAGGTALGVVKGLETAMPLVDKGGKVAQGIMKADKYIGQALGNKPIPQNTRELIDYYSSL
jgi:hypothetical protein